MARLINQAELARRIGLSTPSLRRALKGRAGDAVARRIEQWAEVDDYTYWVAAYWAIERGDWPEAADMILLSAPRLQGRTR